MTRIKTSHGRWGRPLTMTLDELAETLRSDRYAQKVERIALRARDARADADTDDVARRPVRGHDSLPYLIFSSLFSQVGIHDFSQPTGLLLLSITLDGDSQARALLRSRVTQLPQTLMAFTGTSRRTLKVVARCSPADGPLPADSTAYLAFLGMAQQQAARYFEACCQCHVTREKESLERGCRMSHDPEAYYNPEAQPLTVTGSMLGVLDRYPLAVTDRQGRVTSEPSWEEIERERADFYTCVTKAIERVTPTDDDPASVEQLVIELAELCRKSGLPEESAVKRTGYYRRWHLTEDMVRKIFHTVYVKHPEGRPWSQMSEKERIARKVEEFFDRRYELRYNEM